MKVQELIEKLQSAPKDSEVKLRQYISSEVNIIDLEGIHDNGGYLELIGFAGEMGPKCPKCGSAQFAHKHTIIYDLADTHEGGSERFECKGCGMEFYKAEGERLGLRYVLD